MNETKCVAISYTDAMALKDALTAKRIRVKERAVIEKIIKEWESPIEENKHHSEISALFGTRVMGPPDRSTPHLMFRPGYYKPNGTYRPSRLQFMAAVRVSDTEIAKFKVEMNGKMAISGAKTLGVGKEFSGTYIYDKERKILIMKTIVYGPDSIKTIQMEIETGVRPPGWNVPGCEDYEIWSQRICQRANLKFEPYLHSERFGYAEVKPIPERCTLSLEGTEQPSLKTIPCPSSQMIH